MKLLTRIARQASVKSPAETDIRDAQHRRKELGQTKRLRLGAVAHPFRGSARSSSPMATLVEIEGNLTETPQALKP